MEVTTELDSSADKPPLWVRLRDAIAMGSKIGSLVLGIGGYFIPADAGSTRAATIGRWVMEAVRTVMEVLA
ncbi:hypothetical protein [Nocardia brasiliensis]|uniref:hypothetical protein n=1 Tax=Nocardia brasiliensis TaxID=37326 RepID=UPI003D8AF1DB